ncbi:MAG: sigma-70 family RNA polymerase sigma factor [Anaerofustis stercorihominis]|nr:sigma-70 family RNA polymerase sigma factor [Anaerofustis stercorihominis]
MSREYGELNDIALIELYRQEGDEDAFEEILQRYKNLADYHAARVFIEGYEYDDFTQICMIGLFSSVKTFDASRGVSFYTYTSKCMQYQMYQLLRSQNALSRCSAYTLVDLCDIEVADVVGSYGDEYIISDIVVKDIFQVMKDMLTRYEYTIFNEYLAGRSYGEIADLLGLKKKQVDNAICRAKKKISEYYKRNFTGDDKKDSHK